MKRNIERKSTALKLGADKPFSFFHMSDTHLAYADMRDGERKVELMNRRFPSFDFAAEHLKFALDAAISEKKRIVHTGDLIDFVSEANLERAKAFTDATDVFMAAGNHEFSLYVGEAFEDAEYRAQSLDRVQAAFKNPIRFATRIINGVNFVAVDDSYYLFDQWQLDALEAEIRRGLPILLFMHNPIYTEDLYRFRMERYGAHRPAYLTAMPEDKMSNYDEYRYRQQKADAVTLEAAELIRSERLIKAVITGHLHDDYEETAEGGFTQIVTGIGTLREFIIS